MKNFGKILGYNLIILLVYTVAIHLMTGNGGLNGENSLAIMIMMMLAVGFHVLVVFIISMVNFSKGAKDFGKSYLLASLLILVIGFSACWGSAAI